MNRPNIINYCLTHKSFYLTATKDPSAHCVEPARNTALCIPTPTNANSSAASRTQIGK